MNMITPDNLGWTRRPHLDNHGARAWERPDGSFYVFSPTQPEEFTPDEARRLRKALRFAIWLRIKRLVAL